MSTLAFFLVNDFKSLGLNYSLIAIILHISSYNESNLSSIRLMDSSSNHNSYKYNVILSFCGEDTRRKFVDHLFNALKSRGIHTFKDEERIEQGNTIREEIINSIEDSKIFIIVFSKNYASSSWCLDELVKIMECVNKTDQIAYPVFYDVEPTEVRKQTGEVGKAFAKYEKEKAARKWRKSLKKAANIAGWVLKNTANGYEHEVIKIIVRKILLKLHSTNSWHDEKLIGMEPRMMSILSSMETTSVDTHMIGIKGIGGGGKTTLARAIFDKMSVQFDGGSFVENVRELSKAPLLGLKSLQKQVLSDVLHEEIVVSSVGDGIIKMKRMMCKKKVLVVLDDVDQIDQLEALADARSCFEQGSVIIVTTRTKEVLDAYGVVEIHDVDLLDNEEAMRLFSRYAFPRGSPSRRYKKLSGQAVKLAAGLPLTIKVLGASLSGKGKRVWKDALERVEKIGEDKTLERLEWSYESLAKDYKELFLDVACFLKLSHKEDAIRILECCGFNAISGLDELERKCLITITDDQRLGMHDQIQAMGWNVVRRVQLEEPWLHSRLWKRMEIEHILNKDLGTEATCAITLEDFMIKLNSVVFTKGFSKLTKLRLLRALSEKEDDYECLDEMMEEMSCNLPQTLRYLRWEYYPHCSLPSTFQADNLVALEMSYCRMSSLWEGEESKVLNKLKFLNLKHSKLETLNLQLTPKLEKLDLENCYHLVHLETRDGCPKSLVYLNLSGCNLTSFLFIKCLDKLKVLCLNQLYLKEFPDIIPDHCSSSLRELQFRYNNIEALPSTIANFQKLVSLDLYCCTKLRSLPNSISSLRCLKNLDLYRCILEKLPKHTGNSERLEILNLSFAHIKHLPKSICQLKHLKTLNLSHCTDLEELPSELGQLECLEDLILEECSQVRDIPDSICSLERLKYINLYECVRVGKLPHELGRLKSLEVLDTRGTNIRYLPSGIRSLQGLKIYETRANLQSRCYASISGITETSYTSKKQKVDYREAFEGGETDSKKSILAGITDLCWGWSEKHKHEQEHLFYCHLLGVLKIHLIVNQL